MHDKQRTRISKFLSKHLRHEPEALGLTLEEGGWVGVEELLRASAGAGVIITRAELDEVVRRNDKQRFSFGDSGTRIRANQGHSVEVDLQLEAATPPAVLYHGTPAAVVPAILREGLLKMQRHHVHLSPDMETATRVGARRGKPVILEVGATAMHAAGFTFFRSANGIWLVDHVPPPYLRIVEAT